jgi:uncharacterized membrane protein
VVTRAKIYGAFLAVFLLGGVAGGGLVYARTRGDYASLASDETGELRERRRLSAFSRELGLSDDQSQRVRAIFLRYRPERRRLLRAAFEQCGKPLIDHKAKMDAEIRALLRADQQARFDRLLAAQRERFPFGSKQN